MAMVLAITFYYLSAKCPVYFAPAMDLDKPSTIATFKALHEFGNSIIPAESGVSGLSGRNGRTNYS
jgi:phosphopantothenoylcysteine decarboxylase/phosphopantothenate--cysteine ligase